MAHIAPYTPARKGSHGGFNVRATGYPVGATRPNRNAAGMTFTSSRRALYFVGLMPTNDVLKLSVKGTLDSLVSVQFMVQRLPCPCCGSKQGGKLVLNDRGRLHLRALRRRRQQRIAA